MVYICKLYAGGKPEQKVVFQTLLEAERWANKNAGVVRYTVSIYGDVEEDADLLNMFPIKTVLE
jgi:hypothetical protein